MLILNATFLKFVWNLFFSVRLCFEFSTLNLSGILIVLTSLMLEPHVSTYVENKPNIVSNIELKTKADNNLTSGNNSHNADGDYD